MFPRSLILAAVLSATPALAQDTADRDTIRAAITGNTVQGSMVESGAYTEFYAADGTIRGAGYTGAWTVEGDRMCFDYGEGPPTCWSVRIAGDAVTWIDGAVEEGTGTLLPGNPNGF